VTGEQTEWLAKMLVLMMGDQRIEYNENEK
jgi:hypothetical protein